MEIIIHQAILHVLDTTMDAPVLSGSGMEMTAEKTAYFQYHIEKLLASDDIRQCRPLPDSAFQKRAGAQPRFCGPLLPHRGRSVRLHARAHHHSGGRPCRGGFYPRWRAVAGHPEAELQKRLHPLHRECGGCPGELHHTAAGLPAQPERQGGGRCPCQSDRLLHEAAGKKKFDIDGHKDFYLSTVVFQYTTAQPEKKKLQAIQEAAVQAVQENYADQPHVEAQVAMLIANQAADNDNQVSIQQVRQQLEEEYPLAAVPFDDYVEKSDVLEAPEQPVTVTPARIRRMESRSIHTANGIEVKIPTELLNSDNEVEFLHSDMAASTFVSNNSFRSSHA